MLFCPTSLSAAVALYSMMRLFLSFTAKRQDEDYDEQVEETLQDEVSALNLRSFNCCEDLNSLNQVSVYFEQDENDVYILTKVSDILHSVFSSYKEKVLPWFEQLIQLIVQLIVSVPCFQISVDVPVGELKGH